MKNLWNRLNNGRLYVSWKIMLQFLNVLIMLSTKLLSLFDSSNVLKNMTKLEKYFSSKHELYGYNLLLSVLPIKSFIGCTKYYLGSAADMDIFCQNKTFCHKTSEKRWGIWSYQMKGYYRNYRQRTGLFLLTKGISEQLNRLGLFILKTVIKSFSLSCSSRF